MEATQNKNDSSLKFHWYWKANDELDESKKDPEWAPYDLATSHKIEENYLKGILDFEIQINNEIYCIDLKNKVQKLKKDTYRRRYITRACRKHQILVFRKNRFCGVIDSSNSQNNLITSKDYYKNIQVKIKISDLFTNDKDSFMFDESNPIFNTTICISESIHSELKTRFFKKVSFKNLAEVLIYLKSEITEEAKRLTKKQVESLDDNNYLEQADSYIKLLDSKNPPLTLEEKILELYTAEGYLVYSINSVLRKSSVIISKLPFYFLLLQASVGIVSKKYKDRYLSNCLKKVNGESYYVFYRGAQIHESILHQYAKKLKVKTAIFQVYNEFLSTTYELDIASKFAFKDLKIGNVPVLYQMLIKKDIAESIPNLFCFVEDISQHSQEKEVLLSSSTIFQIESLQKKKLGSLCVISASFISNGYNKFDFLKYTSLQKIDLNNNKIGDSLVKEIADAIRINPNINELYLYENQIGPIGATLIGDALRDNSSLKLLNLRENPFSDGGVKAIADALRFNASLQTIYLQYNKIGVEGAELIAEALKFNTSLKMIDLTGNQLCDEGAIAIFQALKSNASVQEIWLFENLIGDEGAREVGDLLKKNAFLIAINLMVNKIGDAGATAIGEGLRYNNSIRRIWLNGNQISVEVDKYLKNKHQDRICITDCLNLEK